MELIGTIYPNHSDSFDLRNVNGVNYVSAVKNQGQANFCQTFAVVGAIESRWMIQGNTEIDLSEADAIVCSPHGENNNSSFGATVLDYIIKRGITTEDKFDTSLIYTNG
jgi:cathepsin C